MAKRLSIYSARIIQKKSKIDNPKDAFADQIGWRSQEIQAVIHRRIKTGEFDKQIAKWVDNRRFPLYRLSRAYYAGTLEAIGTQLHTGFSMGSLVALAKNPKGAVGVRSQVDVTLYPGRPRIPMHIEGGRQKAAAPWHYPPIKYVAVYGAKSKKHPVGFVRDPYGKWRGLRPSGYFWHKTGTLDQAYQQWLAEARLRPAKGDANLHLYGLEPIAAKQLAARFKKYKGTPAEALGRFSFRMPLEYPDLGSPVMNRIVRQAFITGRGSTYRVYKGLGQRNGAPTDVTRIAYPEFRRPWVSRFAAQMGLKQREAIRQLLKKW